MSSVLHQPRSQSSLLKQLHESGQAVWLDFVDRTFLKDGGLRQRFDLDLADIAEVWWRGSVISSWLLDLSARTLAKDHRLAAYSGKVADSGEGRWTIDAAMEKAVPAYGLSAALSACYRSRVDTTFGDKLLSAMRYGFGGHVEVSQ